jgi:glucose/arabinose dehydrogenase
MKKIPLILATLLLSIGLITLVIKQQEPTTINSNAAGNFIKSEVAKGSSLTAMAFAPDGRLFFLEKSGTVKVLKDGQVLASPFLSLSGVNSEGERGLLGIAFDPNFQQNQYIYLYYTVGSPLHNRVSRFTANGDVAAPGSESILIDLPGLKASNHNGGAIHFNIDGKLYIGVGDNANGSNAQNMTTPLGKMLRINSDGTMPTDNPFYATTTGASRAIWAYGFRNPFTFGVQPGTGKIFVNDVGDNGAKRWEEINELKRGGNYGWPNAWGLLGAADGEKPVHAYQEGGCAITGGAFYNPSVVSFPAEYIGQYFFADYCGGWIRILDTTTKSVKEFQSGLASPVDLQVGPDGSLYVLSARGNIQKISYVDSNGNPITIAPTQPQTGQTPSPDSPIGTITSPANQTKYIGGQSFTYTGTATDPQDGTLPDSAFSWTIIFHHAIHTHPFLGPITGNKSGSFTIPQTGEWASDVWYRVQLTVTDSSGLTHTSFVDIVPNTVKLTLATIPSNLQASFDSVPDTSPYTQSTVVGLKRTISVPLTQNLNGTTYTFDSWSDGGSLSHEITAPATDTTYTARYKDPSGTIPTTPITPVYPIIGDCQTNNICPTKPGQPATTNAQQPPNNPGQNGNNNTLMTFFFEFLKIFLLLFLLQLLGYQG